MATAVFKKATEMAGQSALQLIEAATRPQPPTDADGRLGRHIDVKA